MKERRLRHRVHFVAYSTTLIMVLSLTTVPTILLSFPPLLSYCLMAITLNNLLASTLHDMTRGAISIAAMNGVLTVNIDGMDKLLPNSFKIFPDSHSCVVHAYCKG